MTEKNRPRVNSEGQRELEKVETQLIRTVEETKKIDPLSAREKLKHIEHDEQTKLSTKQLQDNVIVLKPTKYLMAVGQKFNEDFRDDYNYAKQYVQFVYEHQEEKGSTLEMWTKPFPGVPAELWLIPANKPISAPRYVKEQIERMNYITRKYVEKAEIGSDFMGTYHGVLEAETVQDRAITRDIPKTKRVFIGRPS